MPTLALLGAGHSIIEGRGGGTGRQGLAMQPPVRQLSGSTMATTLWIEARVKRSQQLIDLNGSTTVERSQSTSGAWHKVISHGLPQRQNTKERNDIFDILVSDASAAGIRGPRATSKHGLRVAKHLRLDANRRPRRGRGWDVR
ncbi:hypothetical protein THAOC_28495, partial [Thalassiosira oceanica]